MSSGVVVIGASGHAKVVMATLQAAGYAVTAVYDDNELLWGTHLMGVPIQGPIEVLKEERFQMEERSHDAVIAIGNNAIRQRLAAALQLQWVSVVHPQVCVHSSVRIGEGTVIFAGAVVQPDTQIGAHVIVNTGATIDHDCIIGNYVHLAPGSHLAGSVQIGEGAFCGIGSIAIPGTKIGEWATVGAGGVVVRDVPASTTVVGVPARPLNQNRKSKI